MLRKNHLARCISLVMVGTVAAPLANAQPEQESPLLIRITEGQSAEAARLSEAAIQTEPVQRLSASPAVSLSRMGGRGLDPVIHGQNEERVDVLIDGMRVEGACPSRMDPPTSRLSTALAPVLEVRTSNKTLRWGPIAGGQIGATTAKPEFAGDNRTAGHLTLGGSDNGEGKLVNGSVAVGSRDTFIRLAGGYDEADDYEDGDGNEVRSSYENAEGRVDAAWTADNGFYIKGLVSRQEERDVKFPGRGMDAPETDTDLYRLELGAPVANGGWNLMAWQADVDHVMDNFSLRESTMKMQTDSETLTRGARLVLDQTINHTRDIAIGVDVESNEWDATMYNGTNLANEASLMWPGVERDRVGVFVEAFHQIRVNTRLGAGIRYDRVEMDATRADQTFRPMPGGMMAFSPSGLYASAYGVTDTEANDNNVSGFMTGEWRFSPSQSLEATASHSVRSPSVNERYVAQKTMKGTWVGNPDLDTEKHHKLEVSLPGRQGDWTWRPAVWVDQVDDYVYRFETRNPDNTTDTRYTNIDARLLGVEGELGWSNGTWSSSSKLASVRGENRDADKALPRIPPIQFIQTLSWHQRGHTLKAQWQLARRQDHVDLESGLDPSTSPGYGVFNLSGTHPLMANLSLTWAVDNLFDNTWAYHVSKDNLSDSGVFRVNEPGRTVRAALTARW
ncbi:TonB-dependent receptor [Marinobacter sp. HL-58]|uniref:TonB-dependent receptor domain-containing protein n=1 Tax=Marinobacter sp. HL-58 TaxID=1479237 RepID=UPI000487DE08|nr:TonB-dependent receptor [Marinobacter sp. HL-58]KPQ00186.1 MAG: TonB-dependent copper receptor OprC [Marinobacter sp. HL-58]